jgi:hypothetical protein
MSVDYRLVSLTLQPAISPNENTEKFYRLFRATLLFSKKLEVVAVKQTNVIKRSVVYSQTDRSFLLRDAKINYRFILVG